jgi:hypothetical protein
MRSEKAKNATEEGFKIANDVYENARKIQKGLENFENEFESNKKRTLEAVNLQDEINRNLNESKDYYEQFYKDLNQLKSNDGQIILNLDYVEKNSKDLESV